MYINPSIQNNSFKFLYPPLNESIHNNQIRINSENCYILRNLSNLQNKCDNFNALKQNIKRDYINLEYNQVNETTGDYSFEEAIIANYLSNLMSSAKENYIKCLDFQLFKENCQLQWLRLQKQLFTQREEFNNDIFKSSNLINDYIFLEEMEKINCLTSSRNNFYFNLRNSEDFSLRNIENSKTNSQFKLNSNFSGIASLLSSLQKQSENINSTQSSNLIKKEEYDEIEKTLTERDSSLISFKQKDKELNSLCENKSTNENSLFTEQFKLACEIYPKKNIGRYNWEERIKFILKFKLKKLIRNKTRKISKKFEGRSIVASKKIRIKGKFVKNPNKVKNLFKTQHL